MSKNRSFVLIYETGVDTEAPVAYQHESLGELIGWALTHLPHPTVLTCWNLSGGQEQWVEDMVPEAGPAGGYIGWDVYGAGSIGWKW